MIRIRVEDHNTADMDAQLIRIITTSKQTPNNNIPASRGAAALESVFKINKRQTSGRQCSDGQQTLSDD